MEVVGEFVLFIRIGIDLDVDFNFGLVINWLCEFR